jgi:hypothetical protein
MQENIKNMANSAKENNILPLFITVVPFKGTVHGDGTPAGVANWNEDRQKLVDTYNAWLEKYTSSKSIMFIDAYKIFEDTGTYRFKPEFVEANTDYHLSKTGHIVLGQHVARLLHNAYIKYLSEE